MMLSIALGSACAVQPFGRARDDGGSPAAVDGSLDRAAPAAGDAGTSPPPDGAAVDDAPAPAVDAPTPAVDAPTPAVDAPSPDATPVADGSVETDLFRNPFDRLSTHHRPVGAGATYGIPPSILKRDLDDPAVEYSPGRPGSRGRLAIVKDFRITGSTSTLKLLWQYQSTWSEHTTEWQEIGTAPDTDEYGGGSGKNLPVTIMMPAPSQAPYPPDFGDNEIFTFGGDRDRPTLAYVFAQYMLTPRNPAILARGNRSARAVQIYPLDGPDVQSSASSPGDWGPGAIDWRHPGGFLRRDELDLDNPRPIRHVLNLTATRHDGEGAVAVEHILSRTVTYPAWNTDSNAEESRLIAGVPHPNNQGDIPYGTRIVIRKEDRILRDSTTANPVPSPVDGRVYALDLSPIGKRLFDAFVYYGAIICDGQGQHVDGGGVLQLRVEEGPVVTSSAGREAVNRQLKKLIPLLWPIFNVRTHFSETEIFAGDGLPYVGGGGPLDPDESVNTAYDR